MALDIFLIILSIQLMSTAAGYRILCVFPIPSRSHDVLGRGVVNALLKAGHEVTWATPYLDNTPKENLTFIDVSNTLRFQKVLSNIEKAQLYSDVFEVKEFAKNVTAATTQSRHLRAALLENNYDAVITEWLFSDAFAGIAAMQKVPWIMFSSVSMHPYLEYLVDEIRSMSIVPMMITEHSLPLNFLQRVMSTLLCSIMYIESMYNLAETTKLYDELSSLAAAKNVTVPPIMEAVHDISILLLNSHSSYTPAQSLPPNVVEIGGFHIDENVPPLAKDIQQILDSSSQGVIYFSMGSLLQSSTFPQQKKLELLQVLGELPYTVLWKFEEEIRNLPKNVHVRPWLPQLSILAHPNVILFITHGGLLSTLEAIHYGMPLLVIPIYGDQHANARRAVEAGFARQLTYSENLARDLRVDLNEMLSDKSYYQRARHLSKLFRNRPVAPSKLISRYVELAIESNGAHHLRSKAQLYAWYQRWMVDQLILFLFVIYLMYKVTCKLIRFLMNTVVIQVCQIVEKRRKLKEY